jgi:ABC-type lipoprotein export system ATPase subunit
MKRRRFSRRIERSDAPAVHPKMTEIESITIRGGVCKDGTPEPIPEVELRMGEVVSIVGHTGSGKTMLINDVEVFANRNTPSMRTILVNGEVPREEFREGPSKNPVALITQHTNFLADLPVARFLRIHARIRSSDGRGGSDDQVVNEVLEFANQLTGEGIALDCSMTELSGGQTRALLIADAVVIGHAPVVLLDEIENAGIHRARALELLHGYRKIFVFVTHDPTVALLSDRRIVMRGGGMWKLIRSNGSERVLSEEARRMDDYLSQLRDRLRNGEELSPVGT